MKSKRVVLTRCILSGMLAVVWIGGVRANVLCDSVLPLDVTSIEGASAEGAAEFLQENSDLLNLQIVWKEGEQDAACATLTVVEVYKIRSADQAGVTVRYHNGRSEVWNFEPGGHDGSGTIKNGKLAIRIGATGGVRIDARRANGKIEATWWGRQSVPGDVVSLPPLM